MSLNKNLMYNNSLRAIASNEKMSKQIDEMICKLDREIDSLRDTYDYILSNVELDEDFQNDYTSDFSYESNTRRLRKPYFSSSLGLVPYNNEIEKLRKEHGSLDFYHVKSQLFKLCSENDYELLKQSVIRNIFDIEHYRFKMSNDKHLYKQLKELNKEFQTNPELIIKRCNNEMLDKIDWKYISIRDLDGRVSAENCRKCCDFLLNPKFNDETLTDIEKDKLTNLVEELGKEGTWCTIAKEMGGNKHPFVYFKLWSDISSKVETSDEWSNEEDNYLCNIVKEITDNNINYENINWKDVALSITNRSARDCEKRWNSLSWAIAARPFPQTEDLMLLQLIKRIGTDRWSDIAREMNERTVDSCQLRYCEIVDELCEWSYFEDRSLWLWLRPYFRDMWKDGELLVIPTNDLTLYKSIIKNFNGRDSVVIRYRYLKLCKWFQLWNDYYIEINSVNSVKKEKPLNLLTTCPEKTKIVMSNIYKILKSTSFFDLVKDALVEIKRPNPDKEANELIAELDNGNRAPLDELIDKSPSKKLMRFLCAIKDINNGVFIPLKFSDYKDRSICGLKYPNRAVDYLSVQRTNVREFESRHALSSSIIKELKSALTKKMSVADSQCVTKLIECEGTFNAALNYAVKANGLNMGDKVSKLLKVLPELLARMMDYVYAQAHQELTIKHITLNINNESSNKREQIAQLLIYRDLIPSIYKTHLSPTKKEEGLITKYLHKTIRTNILSSKKVTLSAKNVLKATASLLQFPMLDNNITKLQCDISDVKTNLPLQTPDRTKFNLFRSLILQKPKLLKEGADVFSNMLRLRYDNPVSYLKESEHLQKTFAVDKSSIPLYDPRYTLLKSRFLSALSSTAVAVRISTLACAMTGDKLHEQQNDVPLSKKISDSYTFNQCLDGPAKPFFKKLKRRFSDCLEPSVVSSSPSERCEILVSHDKPLLRRHSRLWTKVSAPEKNRSFFVPKSVFRSILKNNFTIESINGVRVEDFLE